MKTLTVLIFSVALFAFPVVGLLAEKPPRTKILNIMPLTGAMAPVGLEMQKGVLLALADEQASLSEKVSVTFEDDAFKSSEALNAYTAASRIQPPEVVIGFGSQAVGPLIPVVEQKGGVLIGFSVGEALDKYKGIFRVWYDPESTAEKMLEALHKASLNKTVLISSQHEAMIQYGLSFKSKGANIVYNEEVLPQELDFRNILMKVKVLRPDVVVLSLLPTQIATFAKQARALALNIPLYSFTTAETKSAVDAADGAMEGMHYVGAAVSPEFVNAFKAQHGIEPQTYTAVQYDAMKLILRAVDEGATTSNEIATSLRKMSNFSGVLGEYGKDSSTHFVLRPHLKVIRDGSFALID